MADTFVVHGMVPLPSVIHRRCFEWEPDDDYTNSVFNLNDVFLMTHVSLLSEGFPCSHPSPRCRSLICPACLHGPASKS
jgi:hypothetical protein